MDGISNKTVLLGRARAINITAYVGAVVLIAYGIVNIILNDIPAAIFEIVLGIVLFIAGMLMKDRERMLIGTDIGAIVLLILSIHNFYSGGFDGTGIFWVFVMTMIFFFIKGRDGVFWAAGLIAILFGLSIAAMFEILNLPYSAITLITFFVSLIVQCIVIYIFQRIIDRQVVEISHKNQKLEELVEVNARQQERAADYASKLEKQFTELDKINKIIINRELKMVELKKEIEELRARQRK